VLGSMALRAPGRILGQKLRKPQGERGDLRWALGHGSYAATHNAEVLVHLRMLNLLRLFSDCSAVVIQKAFPGS